MGSWKAGPEKPRTKFCWVCSREFHGRVHTRVRGEDGNEHEVHKACMSSLPHHEQEFTVVYESSTARPAASQRKGRR